MFAARFSANLNLGYLQNNNNDKPTLRMTHVCKYMFYMCVYKILTQVSKVNKKIIIIIIQILY